MPFIIVKIKKTWLTLYLFSKCTDVSLKGCMHSVERLGFAEVLAQVIRKFLLLLLDLNHQLLTIVKVP